MNRIQYTQEIEKRHYTYFENEILGHLLRLNEFPDQLTASLDSIFFNEINFTESIIEFNNYLFIEQQRFFEFFNANIKDFVIGLPYKLRRLNGVIEDNFIYITCLLKSSQKCTIEFKNFFYKLFRYDNFGMQSIYSCYYEVALKETRSKRFSPKVQKMIIDLIIRDYPELSNLKQDFNEFKDSLQFKKKFQELTEIFCTHKNFKNIKIYETLWNDYILILSGNVTICPYCNRQYISPFVSDNGRVRADIDHFFAKRRYPYFSMSLYNLVPSCKQCNQSLKGSKELQFNGLHPFEDDLHMYFHFKLIQVLDNEIDIDIEVDKSISDTTNILEYIDLFKLKHLYNYHSNQASDLLKKRKIYSEEYLTALFSSEDFNINRSFSSLEDLKAFIIGYPIDQNSISSDILLKFKRDISIQLGFQNNVSSNFELVDSNLLEKLKKITFKKS